MSDIGMMHKWTSLENGEWCNQCGTHRTLLQTRFDTENGADRGKFYSYYEIGAALPREVPEREGTYPCRLMPRKYSEALHKWLDIRQRWGRPAGTDASQFFADLDHSALFQRILTAATIFPEPPPLSHSYPNYRLIEQGWDEPMEVWTDPKMTGADTIIIDQSKWKIIETITPTEWVVAYLITDQEKIQADRNKGKVVQHYQRDVLSKSRWRVFQSGTRVYFDKETGKYVSEETSSMDKIWHLERIEDA